VKSDVAVPVKTKTRIATKRALGSILFIGTKLLAFDVILRSKKCNQNYFLVIVISEISRKNTNARYRVGNNLLLVSMDTRMCYNHTKVGSISTERQ
jgi:hypothetical protein